MISLLGSKKAAFGPPGCTLVIKIQKKYKYKRTQIHIEIQNTKAKGMISVLVGKKTALGPPPPRFTLVMKIQNTKHKDTNTIRKKSNTITKNTNTTTKIEKNKV